MESIHSFNLINSASEVSINLLKERSESSSVVSSANSTEAIFSRMIQGKINLHLQVSVIYYNGKDRSHDNLWGHY